MKIIQTGKLKRSEEVRREKPFVHPNHPASVIVLVANTASKYPRTPTQLAPQTTVPAMLRLALEAETEQKAIPRQSALAAPPQWILGQFCGAEGKPRLPGLQTLQGCRPFWCREMRISPLPELASPALLAHLVDGSGAKVQTRWCVRAPSAQTPSPHFVLFVLFFFFCVDVLFYFHVWTCKAPTTQLIWSCVALLTRRIASRALV